MAFEMIEKYRIYLCQSTDTKKTTDIDVGSFCFETDTTKRYIFNGDLWVEYPEMVTNDVLTQAQEEITNGLGSINTDHSNIHYGLGYCVHLSIDTLVSEDIHAWRFKAPTTLYAHLKGIQISSQGATISIKLIKDATITVAGTEITDAIQNLNHNSNFTAQSKFYDSNVAYTGGIVWCQTIVHGSSDNKISNSSNFIQSDYLEYVTKSNDEDYILQIENLSTTDDASNINVNMFFYEENKGLSTFD